MIKKFTKKILVIFCLTGFALSAFSAQSSDQNYSSIFRDLHIDIADGSIASDFSLKNLREKTYSLSHYKGQWILLFFFASWCSVCHQEIPSIEKLYQQYKNKGLVVVGVSLDQDKNSLVSFAKQYSVSFPVFQDSTGKTVQMYNAFGVPTVYLIAPDFRKAGFVQGAFQWSRPEVIQKIGSLLSVRKWSEQSDVTGNHDPSSELPTQSLEPPIIEARTVDGEDVLKPYAWLTFLVNVKWRGSFNHYLMQVPQIELPQGWISGKTHSFTKSGVGESCLTYEFTLKAADKGQYQIGPIKLNYQSRLEKSDSWKTVTHKGIPVVVQSYKTNVKKWFLALFLVSVFVGSFLFYRMKIQTKKHVRSLHYQDEKFLLWKEMVEKAKKTKIHGTRREYSVEVVKLLLWMKQHGISINDELDINICSELPLRLEKIQYGGVDISEPELVYLEKMIERGLHKNNVDMDTEKQEENT